MLTAPTDLRTDARRIPLGIGSQRPEFSWRLPSGCWGQVAFAVQVTAESSAHSAPVWDSGRVLGAEPFGVSYVSEPLESGRAYRWRVQVWTDGEDVAGRWSELAYFETGLLDASRWRAKWISGPAPAGQEDFRALYLRGAVELPAAAVRGRAYVSALRWYRFFVNGADKTGPALVPRTDRLPRPGRPRLPGHQRPPTGPRAADLGLGSVETPYGTAASSWTRHGDEIELEVTVPPGASNRPRLGVGEPHTLAAGTHTVRQTVPIDQPARTSDLEFEPRSPSTRRGSVMSVRHAPHLAERYLNP